MDLEIFQAFGKIWDWFGNVYVLEITTVQICLTLYCKSKFSSRFITVHKVANQKTDILIIFWNAVFKPSSFIRHDLDVVVVCDGIFVSAERGWDVKAGHCGQWAAGLL